MTEPKTLLTKIMGIFMNMDKTIGKDLETAWHISKPSPIRPKASGRVACAAGAVNAPNAALL